MNFHLPAGSVKAALKYSLLPGIIPRLRNLGFGFPFLAIHMAVILGQFGLLSPLHPYLNPANAGRFSIRQVMVEAAKNLRPGFANIDQKIIFFLLLTIFVILAVQFLIMFGMLSIATANAVSFTSMFSSPSPDFDLALVTLDRVFGIPGIFESCVSTGVDCKTMWPKGTPDPASFPTPFQTAFHGLLAFYSNAMLIVGLFILVYYFFALMGETAQTGTPFGKRFDNIYAPLRLVLCIALLLPINYGLNLGQHITLHIANWGSGLASNGWKVFNTGLANALDLQSREMVAKPEIKDISNVLRFMVIAQTCRAGYKEQYNKDIQPYLVRDVRNQTMSSTSYASALNFYDNNDVLIRFGFYDSQRPARYIRFSGRLPPVCGELVIRSGNANQLGSDIVYDYYYRTILRMWDSPQLQALGKALYYAYDLSDKTNPATVSGAVPNWGSNPLVPDGAVFTAFKANWQSTFQAVVTAARNALVSSGEFVVDPKVAKLGWAGAGIWFNKIAEKNGSFLSSIANIPEPVSFPQIMQDIQGVHRATDGTKTDVDNPYKLQLNSGGLINFASPPEASIASALSLSWDQMITKAPPNDETGNIILDGITSIFGLQGLFSIRNNSDVHPFAQIVALGRSLIDHTILFLMGGGALVFGENFIKGMGDKSVFSSGVLSSFLFSIASIGLAAGFFMFYVIPFLPFMYFFFALMKWTVIVFEAIVCVPVWALAHLRIDGEGLMGDPATTGYGQLLEVLLRPIMTIFGLLAAITIFSALVVTLNSIFDLVTSNITGFSSKDSNGNFSVTSVASYRGALDQFVFTVLYVVLVYMIGISSFKMIDLMPAAIFRWMDMDVKNIADNLGSGELLIGDRGVAGVYAVSSRLVTGKIPVSSNIAPESAGLDDVAGSFGRSLGGLFRPRSGTPPPAGGQ